MNKTSMITHSDEANHTKYVFFAKLDNAKGDISLIFRSKFI